MILSLCGRLLSLLRKDRLEHKSQPAASSSTVGPNVPNEGLGLI
jgi:hypothetical protein